MHTHCIHCLHRAPAWLGVYEDTGCRDCDRNGWGCYEQTYTCAVCSHAMGRLVHHGGALAAPAANDPVAPLVVL